MIVNALDLGPGLVNLSNAPNMTNAGKRMGMTAGTFLVEQDHIVTWPRAGNVPVRTETVFVEAPASLGGGAVASQAALRYLVGQLQELAANPLQQPAYIQWRSGGGVIATDADDGWWVITDVTPDMTYEAAGWAPVQITAQQVAPGSAALSTAYFGASLSTTFSQSTGTLSVPFPIGATNYPASQITRTGAFGTVPIAYQPATSLNPLPFQPPATVAGLFTGRVRVYDTISTVSNPIPGAFADDFEGASITPTLLPSTPTGVVYASLGTGTSGAFPGSWTRLTGSASWSISSNVLTVGTPAGGIAELYYSGHPDWTDITFWWRFTFKTNSQPQINIRVATTDGKNRVIMGTDGSSLNLVKRINNSNTVVATTAFAPVNNTTYWLKGVASGTAFTMAVFSESGNLPNASLASVSGTISDSAVATGYVAIGQGGGATATFTCGGAFSNVCIVQSSYPTGWLPVIETGEPALCWSTNAPLSGSHTGSVNVLVAGDVGSWQASTVLPAASSSVLAGSIKTSAGTAVITAGGLSTTNGTSSWAVQSGSGATTSNPTVVCRQTNVGLAYFDSVSLYVGGGGSVNSNWVEVFDPSHRFAGDMLVTNGLFLFLVSVGGVGITGYLWNTALSTAAWQPHSTLSYQSVGGNTSTIVGASLLQQGPLTTSVRVRFASLVFDQAAFTLGLTQADQFVTIAAEPLSEPVTAGLFVNLTSISGAAPKFLANPGAVADVAFSAASLASQTDYGWSVLSPASAAAPYLYGLLWRNEPAAHQPTISGATIIGTGESALPLQNTFGYYGWFAVPFTSAANLVAYASTGTLGTGWSSAADAGSPSGFAAQCAASTGSGNADLFGTSWVPTVGLYDLWVFMKVSSAVNATPQMQVGLWDVTSSAFVASTTYAPSGVTTAYVPYRVASSVTPTGGHNMQFRAVTTASTVPTWSISEAFLIPRTLLNGIGPQQIWTQYLYAKQLRQVIG